MCDTIDKHFFLGVINAIQNAVLSLSNAVAVLQTHEFSTIARAGILG